MGSEEIQLIDELRQTVKPLFNNNTTTLCHQLNCSLLFVKSWSLLFSSCGCCSETSTDSSFLRYFLSRLSLESYRTSTAPHSLISLHITYPTIEHIQWHRQLQRRLRPRHPTNLSRRQPNPHQRITQPTPPPRNHLTRREPPPPHPTQPCRRRRLNPPRSHRPHSRTAANHGAHATSG
jgi:hypothetical protein